MGNKVGGTIGLIVDGERIRVKGNWTFNLGSPKRDAVLGADEVHGYKEMPQIPFIEGAGTIVEGQRPADLFNAQDVEIMLQHAGNSYVWRSGWFAGEGNVTTEEGEVALRYESLSAEQL